MKTKLLFTALCIALPLSMMAQDDDDMYFVPKKKDKKERKSEEAKAERPDFVRYEEAVTDAEPAPDYHVGALRSDDEYNRRGRYGGSNYGEVRVGNDTVYVVEEESQAPKVTEEDDYACSGRLVRFYGGVLSPFYWDYYYDWAFYDPWFYSPWHVGFHYGPYGWYGGWYGPWYHHGWYDPWYDPWYHGCWGWVSHHPVGGTEGSRFGGRRGLSGLSASRGNRFDYTRGSMSASRTARTTTERASATRGTRLGEGSSRIQGILGNRNTSSTQRTQRSTATQRSTTTQRSTSSSRSERSYTPSRSYSSGSVSSGSFGGGGSRGGGSFGGGGSRGGGGRGGR